MESKNNNSKRRIIIIIAAVVIAALLIFLLPSAPNKGNDAGSSSNTSENATEQAAEENGGSDEDSAGNSDVLEAVLFCASDYQIEEDFDTPDVILSDILDSPIEAGKSIDGVIYCGDYTNDRKLHDYQISPEESIAEIKGVLNNKIDGITDDDMVFVQGNHDAMTESITATGLHDYGDYLVYVLNTENDFPWKQGKVSGSLKKVQASSKALRECLQDLAANGETRPVIIAGHVPLHFTARTSSRHSTGDNLYSSLIFDAVNESAESLDIIYLYGHNHSKGWDCYMGGGASFLAPGDTILIPQFKDTDVNSDTYTEEQLNFTYFNAGYTGYYMNCGTEELDAGTWRDYNAADTALTGTTIEIYSGRIVITRWDKDGVHNIRGDGEANPYKGGIDEGLIPEEFYSQALESPQEIIRKGN